MSRPSPIHICYYSNQCKWSKAFLTELKDTPYVSQFHFICVDPSPNRQPLPNWLKQTPTIVIRGESEPRINDEVMNWLYEEKIKGTASTKKQGAVGPDGSPQGGGGFNEPDPYALSSGAGFHFDDSYAFIGGADGQASSHGMPGGIGEQSGGMHNHFTFLNGQGSVGTRDGSSIQATEKLSKKAKMLDDQYKMYMQDRDAGMPMPVARQ